MERAKSRQKIRENLNSGQLPKDFDVTFFCVGSPPASQACEGCGEVFSPSVRYAIARVQSRKRYWFHEDCEKMWQEERHHAVPNGGSLKVKAYERADFMIIEVADTGAGIPEGLNVFQLFRTTKPEGTGLGLPIVEQIISEHHGSVDYVSELGKGTTFRITLPVSDVG